MKLTGLCESCYFERKCNELTNMLEKCEPQNWDIKECMIYRKKEQA